MDVDFFGINNFNLKIFWLVLRKFLDTLWLLVQRFVDIGCHVGPQ